MYTGSDSDDEHSLSMYDMLTTLTPVVKKSRRGGSSKILQGYDSSYEAFYKCYGQTLYRSLAQLNERMPKPDWTVVVRTIEFPVHSALLEHLCAAQDDSLWIINHVDDSERIVLDCDPHVFRIVHEYIYTGCARTAFVRLFDGVKTPAELFVMYDTPAPVFYKNVVALLPEPLIVDITRAAGRLVCILLALEVEKSPFEAGKDFWEMAKGAWEGMAALVPAVMAKAIMEECKDEVALENSDAMDVLNMFNNIHI